PVARWLIERNRLLVRAESDSELEALGQQEQRQHAVTALDGNLLLRLLTCVLLVMVLGFWLGDALQERLGLVLPSYVGAMFIAIVLRNLDDRLGWLRIPDHTIGTLGDVCLGIFLTMAMMSLKFWELENLGLPLLGVLFIQVVALLLLTIFVLFRLLGRNYDAAVLCAGFLGHGLGATPNAVANMGAVCEHYRVFSRKAFIIVPLCGAVLIDLVAIPAITWFINAFS
ncbi:sodium:glutamate symporter, partial [Pseudomonas aeruginosa]